jgi:hypothetical protein
VSLCFFRAPLHTDIGNSTSLKIKKFSLQNLVLIFLHGSLERKEQVLKPKEVKVPEKLKNNKTN